MHALHSKTGRLAILILLESIQLARDRIQKACTAAVIRFGNETVEGTVNGFAARSKSELAV